MKRTKKKPLVRGAVGFLFNMLLIAALGLFMYGAYPREKGYNVQDRSQLNAIFAAAERDGLSGLVDAGFVPPIFVADLPGHWDDEPKQ